MLHKKVYIESNAIRTFFFIVRELLIFCIKGKNNFGNSIISSFTFNNLTSFIHSDQR